MARRLSQIATRFLLFLLLAGGMHTADAQPVSRPEVDKLIRTARTPGLSPDSIDYYLRAAMNRAEESGDPGSLGNASLAYSLFLRRRGKLEQALSYADRSLEAMKAARSEIGISSVMALYCNFYRHQGKYAEALDFGKKALLGFHIAGDTLNERYAGVLIELGGIYTDMQELESAESYFEEALQVATEIKHDPLLATALVSLSFRRMDKGELDEGIEMMDQALDIFRKDDAFDQQAILMVNLSNAYLIKGDDARSWAYLQSALDMCREKDFKPLEAQVLAMMAEQYRDEQKYSHAVMHGEQAYALAEMLHITELQASAARNLGLAYAMKGDTAQAYRYQQIWAELRDSLNTGEESRRIGQLETELKFQREAVAREKEAVERENLILKQEAAQMRLIQVVALLSGLVLLLGAALLLGAQMRKNRRLRREKELEHEFAEQLIRWQEQERKRVAHELHDGLGQQLSMIKNNLQGGEYGTEDMVETVGNAIQEVRNITQALRPMQLDILGLKYALMELAEDSFAHTEVEVQTHVGEVGGLLGKDEEMHLYRIIQECIQNILKHAACSRVEISVLQDNNYIRVQIADNGKGFDPQQVRPGKQGGYGLHSIAERVTILHGKWQIDSRPGKGTRTSIEIPLNHE